MLKTQQFPLEVRIKKNSAMKGYRIIGITRNNAKDTKVYPICNSEAELMQQVQSIVVALYKYLKQSYDKQPNARKTAIIKDRIVMEIETNFTTVENISCIDLPGLIKNADVENPDDSIVTEEIIEEYTQLFPSANLIIVGMY